MGSGQEFDARNNKVIDLGDPREIRQRDDRSIQSERIEKEIANSVITQIMKIILDKKPRVYNAYKKKTYTYSEKTKDDWAEELRHINSALMYQDLTGVQVISFDHKKDIMLVKCNENSIRANYEIHWEEK